MPEPESTDTLNNPLPGDGGAAKDTAAPGGAKAASATPDDALAAARAEAAASHDRYLRTVADLENFRRRTVREKEELRLFAASRVLEDLLPVLDNLSLALAAAKQPGADTKGL